MPIFTRYKLSGEFKPDDELKQFIRDFNKKHQS